MTKKPVSPAATRTRRTEATSLALEQTPLAASRAIVAMFIDAESSDFTVRQMAAHAGISERTFYRYFPTREDVVRPVIDVGMQSLAAEMAKRPLQEPIIDALAHAFRNSWVVVPIERSRILFSVMNQTETFRAVWRQAMSVGERQWSELIAQRLQIAPDSHRAILTGAVISTAVRLSFECAEHDQSKDPGAMFSIFLKLLDTQLFVLS
ncbi:TetR/AcrR family transcriptional regulator [Herbaspirillum autotrophicum]|uniref:TetR/AcrR family transcriptional regulator n=1 Tax=Herbaspirillum autotrophicum TaxID=180195 RepID=UPI0009F85893|nr:TetR/AcrR family transcriptional regulator [Herbaspirillum autotrophicum]